MTRIVHSIGPKPSRPFDCLGHGVAGDNLPRGRQQRCKVARREYRYVSRRRAVVNRLRVVVSRMSVVVSGWRDVVSRRHA